MCFVFVIKNPFIIYLVNSKHYRQSLEWEGLPVMLGGGYGGSTFMANSTRLNQ